jgi:hypothetical protein
MEQRLIFSTMTGSTWTKLLVKSDYDAEAVLMQS